jgi:hypothetical protein
MASRKGGPPPVKQGAVSRLSASMAGLALDPGGGAPAPSGMANELARRGFAPGLDTLPIYFVSTHGAYDVRDAEAADGSKVPWNVEDETWTVPPGTHIFETMAMGDLCLTEIDQHLWDITQGTNRDKFLRFLLTGQPPDAILEMVIQQLYYYGPGTKVAKRTLSIGGGKREEEGPAYAGPEREPLRRAYINMGFYAFPVGAPANVFPDMPRGDPESRIRSMTGVRTAMIEDGDISHTSDEIIDMIKAAEGVDGGIFMFSSCAEIHRGEERAMQRKYQQRVSILEEIQADARRDMMAKEIPFAPGGSGRVIEARARLARGTPAQIAAEQLRRRMAAIKAAPGGPVTLGRFRGTEESFAPGANGEEAEANNNGPNLEFADSEGADELLAQNMATATGIEIPSAAPTGRSVYYKIIATSPGQSMTAVVDETGSPFLTPTSLRLALRDTPLVGREVLYKYRKGTTGAMRGKPIFSKVKPGAFGGTRRNKRNKGRQTLRRRS